MGQRKDSVYHPVNFEGEGLVADPITSELSKNRNTIGLASSTKKGKRQRNNRRERKAGERGPRPRKGLRMKLSMWERRQ